MPLVAHPDCLRHVFLQLRTDCCRLPEAVVPAIADKDLLAHDRTPSAGFDVSSGLIAGKVPGGL
jgi:hypothetical protein